MELSNEPPTELLYRMETELITRLQITFLNRPHMELYCGPEGTLQLSGNRIILRNPNGNGRQTELLMSMQINWTLYRTAKESIRNSSEETLQLAANRTLEQATNGTLHQDTNRLLQRVAKRTLGRP
ncbi:hypothetical protein PoB_006698900 [Plakobranchus ocellatus]|uniref:Uncharacterized protein n=1 Tax=Plakobranchus ocellatus TaxID=259542 RepID=A0AAV4D8J9_9GAST|nr:hypothetical protein PoB_006698900 [Plakobranchus ocellatus]